MKSFYLTAVHTFLLHRDKKASWLTTSIDQGNGQGPLYVEYYSLLPVLRVPALVFFTAGVHLS
jgi:hypothetical protein